MTSRQKTWTIGGLALIACGVIGMLQMSLTLTPSLAWLGIANNLLYAIALLLFAFGFSREASVVERKPLGTTALAVLGIWPICAFGLRMLLLETQPLGGDGWMMYGYVAIALPTAAAIVATMQIARSGVVSGVSRWLPLCALAIYAVAWTVPQIAAFISGPVPAQGAASVFTVLAMLAFFVGTVGLGVVALVLSARQGAVRV